MTIAEHYDARLREHGDTARGADWPNQIEREVRFDVMLDVMRDDSAKELELLDFACGSGDLLRHIGGARDADIHYKGVDISATAIELARRKFPSDSFNQLDILATDGDKLRDLACDYCVINGLFTVKADLDEEQMWRFLQEIIEKLWPIVRCGLAFNVMSTQVDWRRADLFHVSMDRLAQLMHGIAGRNIAFRADYGLYEYTCYAYKSRRVGQGWRRRPSSAPLKGPLTQTGKDAVCRPLLPRAATLQGRLASIDQSRWYSNWGPLTRELELGLCELMGQDQGHCVTASNGTDAITAAILAVAGRASQARNYCLMPSYTFVATAIAAMNAGYTPYLIDIDPRTFAMEPEQLVGHPAMDRAGVVIAVCPYGAAVDAPAWSQLAASSGVPVVIDAAASLDSFASGRSQLDATTPVVLSLHATKAFGVGEGGVVLARDLELIKACKRSLNFGFLGDRTAMSAGINGKMSEYHAAVGLAELEGWQTKREAYMRVTQSYLRASRDITVGGRLILGEGHVTGYALYVAETPAEASRASARLLAAGVDHRLWYGLGLHRQPAYELSPADALPVTEDLAPRLIGLPYSVDMSDEAISQVMAAL